MFYTGCSYQGETTPDGKRFNDQGVYTFANGDTYVGAFKDGRMHGHGTLFFTAERGGGQYRGVWENGRNVSGAFVFSDGLVYGSEETGAVPTAPAATPAVKDGADETERKTNGRENLAEEWLYCREGDRRLWAEHLREVMPVLPLQAVLGGERVPQSSRWAAEPVVAPCVAAEAKIPATFVQGQPRCLSDVPPQFWEDPVQRETVVACMQLPTPPFKGAQGGAGREETIVDSGGRLAMNLSLRKIAPLESEAMRRAIAAAVSASAAASKVRSPLEELHKPSENTDPHSAPQLAAGASVEGQSTHVPESSEKETVPTNNDTQSNDERHSPEERASSPTVEDGLYASLRKQQLEAEVKTNDDLTEHGEEQHAHSAAGEEERASSPTVEDELYASLRKQQLEAEVKTNDDLMEHGEEQHAHSAAGEEERALSPTVKDELYASLRKQQLEAEVKTNDDLMEHGEEQHAHSAAGEEERASSPTVEDELYASLRKQQLEAEVKTNDDLMEHGEEQHAHSAAGEEERASSPTVEDELYASLRKQQLEAEVKTNDDLTEHGEEQHAHSAAGEEERALSPTVKDELYASLRKQQLEAEVKTNDDLTEHGEEQHAHSAAGEEERALSPTVEDELYASLRKQQLEAEVKTNDDLMEHGEE